MKMESITNLQLLRFYIATTYPGRDVLAANLTGAEFEGEVLAFYEQCKHCGVEVPITMQMPGWVIIEMNSAIGKRICNHFDRAFFSIYVFEDGKCVHENC